MNGSYYKSGSDWFSASVKDVNGSPVDFRFNRYGSRDLAKTKNDPAAVLQSFTIETACNEQCVLQVYTSDNHEGQLRLGEDKKPPFNIGIGQGTLIFDSIAARPNPAYITPWTQDIGLGIRKVVLTHYGSLFRPLLMLGAVAFLLATVIYWKKTFGNVCYVLALASWTLVLARATLLNSHRCHSISGFAVLIFDAGLLPVGLWSHVFNRRLATARLRDTINRQELIDP